MILRLVASLIVLLVFSPVITTSPQAKVYIKERDRFYTVRGKTGERLWRSIDRRGPKVRRVHAVATTDSRFKFKRIRTGVRRSKCVITNVDVHVNITYRYPKWANRRSASRDSKKKWDRFYKQLVRHEQQHGKINKNLAKQVHREIKRANGRVSKDCRDLMPRLKKKMDRLYQAALRRHQRLDRRDGYVNARIRRAQRQTLKIK